MLASVASATLLGVEGRPVRVEVHVSKGLPAFTVVGLPDTTCREARDRVRAALMSSRLAWPNARVTVNLAPPGVRLPHGQGFIHQDRDRLACLAGQRGEQVLLGRGEDNGYRFHKWTVPRNAL